LACVSNAKWPVSKKRTTASWDNAVAAGWEAALIKGVGNDVLGVGPQPMIVGNDLNVVADQLIARHKAGA
jgi:2-haloacid dehalogenase